MKNLPAKIKQNFIVLGNWEKAKQAIALCKNIDEVKAIRDKAEALRAYAKQSDESLEMQNQCAEIKIRAERRGGELLKDTARDQGETDKTIRSHDVTLSPPPKLEELGISKNQSHRWQQIADVPNKKFEIHISTILKKKDTELTTRSVLNLAKSLKREKARKENASIVETNICEKPKLNYYQTIVIDPPWDISEMGDNEPFARSEPTYASMTIEQIINEHIEQYAANNCHLYLWTINRMIFIPEQIIKAWGFRYVTMLTWCKETIGMGNYYRNNTEHVIFCIRGKQALLRNDVGTWFVAPRGTGGHSSKPQEFYKLIESCSPGPRLDYFARNERIGWDVYGGEL